MSLDQHQESSIQKVTRTPVHRQVQEAIRQFILENDLKPGSQLPAEGQLADLLGVSRNSVREGVKALEVQGVVEVRVGNRRAAVIMIRRGRVPFDARGGSASGTRGLLLRLHPCQLGWKSHASHFSEWAHARISLSR